MIVFSLQKNKLWNGTGFIIKPGSLELSSMCFAEQSINIGSGEYKVKLVGSSLSGNGIVSFQLMLGGKEIESKQITLNSRANTEISFDIGLRQPGPYIIKLSRGRESIGRISIDLFTLFKFVEPKKEPIISTALTGESGVTFFIIDYNSISSPSQLTELFVGIRPGDNSTFLLKVTESAAPKLPIKGARLFFGFEQIRDYLSLFGSKKVFYSAGNIELSDLLMAGISDAVPIIINHTKSASLTGLVF